MSHLATEQSTWYFSSVDDPFGTGARTASIARASATAQAERRGRRAQFRFRGHVRLGD